MQILTCLPGRFSRPKPSLHTCQSLMAFDPASSHVPQHVLPDALRGNVKVSVLIGQFVMAKPAPPNHRAGPKPSGRWGGQSRKARAGSKVQLDLLRRAQDLRIRGPMAWRSLVWPRILGSAG